MIDRKGVEGLITVPIPERDVLVVKNSKSLVLNGSARQGVWVHNFLDAPVGRFFHRLYFCQYVRAKGTDATATISSSNGRRLIHFHLPESEVIAINLAYLVAFTKSIRIRTYGNFSIPAFACDLNILSVFQGPGDIVLETSGNHEYKGNEKSSFSPKSLVAWDPSIQFNLGCVDGPTDLYFHPVRLACKNDARNKDLIVDNGFDDNKSFAIGGFIRHAFSWIFPRI
jgi:uncharacterized protein (AIM24 family)